LVIATTSDYETVETMGTSPHRQGNSRPTGQEQYYTPAPVAERVVEMVLERYPSALKRLWIEPCGGTGRFLDAYVSAGIEHFWSCDTAPADPRVGTADFLAMPASSLAAFK
jgi:predicted RNA methylase